MGLIFGKILKVTISATKPTFDGLVTARKGRDVYLLHYDQDTKSAAMHHLGMWAANPELNFSWANASECSGRIRAIVPS